MTELNQRISKLIETAKALIGKPYKYGATPEDAPRFFDCSSFTQYVFKQVGVKLPRTSIEQAMVGKKISLKNLKPGDLIFFHGEIGRYNKYFPEGIGHAGIYIGNNQVIHANRKRITGKYVGIYDPKKIKEVGEVIVEDLNKMIRDKKLVTIGRFF
ncbi:MAG: C40 family peptidase [Candidatus Yanofskybacteria bacterium]|nr:C40 family peptidase [Candidatus Yanofskybacteria bacterium]